MRDFFNILLCGDIYEKKFSRLCLLLRSGDFEKIDQETWNMLSDHLEGKLKRKRGPRFSMEKDNRNFITWERCQTLMSAGLSQEEAIAKLAMDYESEGTAESTAFENVVRNQIQEFQKHLQEVVAKQGPAE